MIEFISQPWPWYVAGPLIGLMVPMLMLLGGKSFGISSSMRHLCALAPIKPAFFNYSLKNHWWNLVLVTGLTLGGFIALKLLSNPNDIALSTNTISDLGKLGLTDFSGMTPPELFGWESIKSPFPAAMMIIGGFLVGFGTSYAGGCTSGHCITGLSKLNAASLAATIGFFAGGLIVTHFVLPFVFELW